MGPVSVWLLLHAVVPGEAALQGAEPVVGLVSLGDGGDGVGAHAHPHNVPPGQLLALLAVEADPGGAARVSGDPQVQLCIVWQDDRPAWSWEPQPPCVSPAGPPGSSSKRSTGWETLLAGARQA